jgi:putative PIN family toxin of toxin-antitoxin system
MGKTKSGMSQRVVLDTNCVISALLFSRQSMAWLRHSWQNAHITPLASKDTVRELIRVLAYPKFKLNKAEQALLLADFLPYTETVVIEQIPDGLPIISDPADQKFLILAVVGQAEVLVTGDTDILAIKSSFHTPPIMALAEYKVCLQECWYM